MISSVWSECCSRGRKEQRDEYELHPVRVASRAHNGEFWLSPEKRFTHFIFEQRLSTCPAAYLNSLLTRNDQLTPCVDTAEV